MKASLVIPTYNKVGRLKLVIESLNNQKEARENFEVIIVDDGSTDETAEFVKHAKIQFDCHYILQKNRGRACARNNGIHNAHNEIIIFSDDDLILEPDFIYNHIMHHRKKKQVVHGRIMNLSHMKFFKDPIDGTFIDSIDIRPSVRNSLIKMCILPEYIQSEELFLKHIVSRGKMTALESSIKYLLEKCPGSMDWISFVGGNVSILKQTLVEVNGFDESFGLKWGCEDVELGYRLMKKGLGFYYADDAVNYHIAHYRHNFSEEHSINLKYFYDKYEDEQILHFSNFISKKISKDEFLEIIKVHNLH